MATIYLTEDGRARASVKVGDILDVVHPFYGGVEMEVIDVNGNIISASYDDLEFTVRLKKSYLQDGLHPNYRFVAEEL